MAGFDRQWENSGRIGHFEVTLVALDSDGGVATTVVDHDVLSRPPVANAGPDLTASAGGSLTLDGSASTDPDTVCADRVDRWEWDVDGNGTFEVSSLTAATTVIAPGPGSYTVTLQVTDRHGVTDTDTLTLTVL